MKKAIILSLILVALVSVYFAFDLTFYKPIDVLMMGDTFTGISNTAVGSVYYNPAGLVNSSGFTVELPGIDSEVSPGLGDIAINVLKNYDEIQSVISSTNTAYIGNYLLDNYARDIIGRNMMALKTNAYMGYASNNIALGIGGFGQAYARSYISNDMVPSVTVDSGASAFAEGAGAFGFNLSSFKVSVGGTYRYGYELPEIYSINGVPALSLNSSDFNPNTTAVATSNADLGVRISSGSFVLGGLWHNALTSSSTPDVRIGAGWITKNFTAGIDLANLLDSRYSVYSRLHLGLEYKPFDFLTFYGGLSSGWFTGGAELDIGSLKLRGGTYVINYGYNAGYDYQRMYVLSFSL